MKTYKFPKSPKIIRKKSNTGLGIFANEDIKKGQFIIEYTGEKITTEEADRRGGQYLYEINSKWTIDGKGRDNLARYINHSCKPNAEADVKGHQVVITAIKNIPKGTEITYDYGLEFWNEFIKPKGCKCSDCKK
jgi:SET domain-containing protein